MIDVHQGDQHRYFMYDSLGRLLRVRQPEQQVNTALNTSGNPDNNSWTAAFTYDNNGNVLTATDAKNVTITNTYDELNRVEQRSYNDSPQTPTVTFTYDEFDHAKGKLTKVASSISESRYTEFDVLGRLKQFQQYTDGTTYTSSYDYNLSGALVKETYPSGRVVENDFDNNGDLSRIFGKPTSTATEQTYATGFGYFPDGKIEKLRLGNGLWESGKLNSRLQAIEITMGYSVGDGSLMKLNYEYGELQTNGTVDTTKNAGNIAKQTINFDGLAHPFIQTYKYDSLDRISEAIEKVNGTQTWKQTYAYDIYGNRIGFYQKVGATELSMDGVTLPSVEAATNRFSGNQGYTYDENGNITADLASGGRTFIFNGDNKQTEVKNASNVTIGRYHYDGNGMRVKKVTDAETTVFAFDGFGKLIAEYSTTPPPQNPTIIYTATDTLGSPRVLTDKLGQVISRRDFMPFGEELYADGSHRKTSEKFSATGQDAVRQRFTGYQKDSETNLDFAEARYYQNQHGRFTAVDPLLASGKSHDPQTFNRYVYAMNQPTRLVDPTGLQATTSEGDGVAATIQTWICKSFWCKVKEGWNHLVRAVVGERSPQDLGEQAEIKSDGDPLRVKQQVGNAVKNYANDVNIVNEFIIQNDPTALYNAQKAIVNNSLGRASDEEVYSAMASAGLNTAATVTPTGRVLGTGRLVKHHIFNAFRGSSSKSEVFRQFFQKHGIDVDSFLVEIAESMHKKFIHGAGNNWTTRWKEWIKANPDASTKEVYQFAGKLMDEYGLSGLPIVR